MTKADLAVGFLCRFFMLILSVHIKTNYNYGDS